MPSVKDVLGGLARDRSESGTLPQTAALHHLDGAWLRLSLVEELSQLCVMLCNDDIGNCNACCRMARGPCQEHEK